MKRQLTVLFRIRKLEISNIYSPRQAGRPQDRKKFIANLDCGMAWQNKYSLRLITRDKTAIMCIFENI